MNNVIDIARVFFHYEKEGDPRLPSKILLQRLENHTDNVAKLVQLWQREASDTDLVLHPDTEQKVVAAARLHDVGKPQRFTLQARTRKQRKNGRETEIFEGYEYSFRGHRFLAEHEDLYVQELAQGHHTYTVQDINEAIVRLRQNGYPTSRFARDLYILEMCDQIEAEIAVRTLEGVTEGRTFMEFTVIPGDPLTYHLDPYPFIQEEIDLTLEYYELVLSEEQKAELLNLKLEEPERIAQALGEFIVNFFKEINRPVKQTMIRIKPLIPEISSQPGRYDCETFYLEICGFTPYEMQQVLFNHLATGEDALLLRAPTGSGKTEAVLIPSLALGKRLILPLPTRSLIEDHEQRIQKYLMKFSTLSQNKDRPIALIVDTGETSRRYVFRNGEAVEFRYGSQVLPYEKRHLYKAEVILTTLDKFLYRYFGFGDVHKSFIYPLRIQDGARTLICFDEAHTYDGVSFINFRRLVRALYESGQGVVVMTATLPEAYKKEIDFLKELDYLEVSEPPKRKLTVVESKHNDLSDALVEQTERLWRQGIHRIIVVAESVGFQAEIQDSRRRALRDGVFNVYEKLKGLVVQEKLPDLMARKNLLLYHGRMDGIERARVYEKLKKLDGNKDGRYLLVTTSAIEVGCDLNAQALVTEICNPEQLIQRVGRCNRRADFEDAEVVVVLPKELYSDRGWIKPYVRSLSIEEEACYIEYLKQVSGNLLDLKTLREKIARRPAIDYRVETLFELLAEYVYEARLENKPIHDRGFVVTRSWEPTLTFEIPFDGEKRYVSVPFSLCVCSKDEQPEPAALIQEVVYSHDTNREFRKKLSGGPVYGKQVIVTITEGFAQSNFKYDPEYGLVDVPKVFTCWRTDYKVLMQVAGDGAYKPVIWYFRDLPDNGYFTGYLEGMVTEEEVVEEETEEEERE
ncbi:MAG TPA: CRISPR-associated helicase Cas3' [Candidatus Limnocylindrales bacterium]|nr:CRISPR-associated helicase Cas3' [Candidatus Limnocylindrales bacterium]